MLPSVIVYASTVGMGFSYGMTKGAAWPVVIAFGGCWLVGTCLFYLTPIIYKPTGYSVPLNPWIPSFGVLCSVFLIGTLNPSTWWVWLWAQLAGLAVFVLYGVVKYIKWRRDCLPTSQAPDDAAAAVDSQSSKAVDAAVAVKA
jgi:membrane associated rhomboid family serine protease